MMIVCSEVLVLGLLSAGTGTGAELERVKELKQCVYKSSFFSGNHSSCFSSYCTCHYQYRNWMFCCARVPRQSIVKWILMVIYFGLSWLTFDVAFLSFLIGAVKNIRYHGHSISTCHVMKVKPSDFADSCFSFASAGTKPGFQSYQGWKLVDVKKKI